MEELLVAVLLEITLEPYLRCVVGAEVYPHWPIQALKAQAVASRSYALWRLRHPRTGEVTLYGDARDQAFDCQRRHERTDRAVRDTEGEVVRTGDPEFVARYVNLCGLDDCPACQGEGGHDGKKWPGRMCQFGAKTLADRGLTYVEILQYYYGGDAELRRYDE